MTKNKTCERERGEWEQVADGVKHCRSSSKARTPYTAIRLALHSHNNYFCPLLAQCKVGGLNLQFLREAVVQRE